MTNVFEQYAFNVTAGRHFESADALPADRIDNPRARIIAYYLPQFHKVDENDEWWGAGFTEWTNVTKALPRYVGHQQPLLPADLGFYDLSNVDILRQQARLARQSGVHGFCIHDYWFAGRKVLETPLRLLLENTDIDLPFCLSWANENWSRRWDGSEDEVLLEQLYDPSNLVGYPASIVPALRDERYIKVDGRPLILVYRPRMIPHAREMFAAWRTYLVELGLGDPFLVMAQTFGDMDPRPYGLDGAAGFPPHGGNLDVDHRKLVKILDPHFRGQVAPYDGMADAVRRHWTTDYRVFPGVAPGWDNEARKPGRGLGFYGATPAKYSAWLDDAVKHVEGAPPDERLVFVNAWNEWAEGAVLEPDRHHGHAYLLATRRVVETAAAAVRSPEEIDRLAAPRVTERAIKGLAMRNRARSGLSDRVPVPVKTGLKRLLAAGRG